MIVALFFIGMLIPMFVTEIARFKIVNGIGLYNTLGAPAIHFYDTGFIRRKCITIINDIYIPYLYMPTFGKSCCSFIKLC